MFVEVVHSGEKRFRILGERDHILQHPPVVFFGQKFVGDIEQFAQSLVHHQPLPAGVHDQKTVDGGVRLRFQKCGLRVELGLRLFPPCYVAKKPIRVEHSVFLISTHRAILNPDPDSILTAEAVFLLKDALPLKQGPIGLIHPPKILGVDATHPETGAAGADFRLGVPKQRLHLWADVSRTSMPVGGPSHIRRTRQDSAKLLLALAQHVSGLLYLGDVLNRHHIARPIRWPQQTHPVVCRKASPIFTPKNLTDNIGRLMGSNCFAEDTLLGGVSGSIGVAVMQHFVEILSDNFFHPITRHLRQCVITERGVSFRIHTADALDDSIQDRALFSA